MKKNQTKPPATEKNPKAELPPVKAIAGRSQAGWLGSRPTGSFAPR